MFDLINAILPALHHFFSMLSPHLPLECFTVSFAAWPGSSYPEEGKDMPSPPLAGKEQTTE